MNQGEFALICLPGDVYREGFLNVVQLYLLPSQDGFVKPAMSKGEEAKVLLTLDESET